MGDRETNEHGRCIWRHVCIMMPSSLLPLPSSPVCVDASAVCLLHPVVYTHRRQHPAWCNNSGVMLHVLTVLCWCRRGMMHERSHQQHSPAHASTRDEGAGLEEDLRDEPDEHASHHMTSHHIT